MFIPVLILALASPLFAANPSSMKKAVAQENLFMGARKNDPKKIAAALADGANINQVFADGSTPLTTAIKNKATEAALELISRGADVNKREKYANDWSEEAASLATSPLIYAIMYMNYPVIKAMLNANVTVEANHVSSALQAVTLGGFDKNVFQAIQKAQK